MERVISPLLSVCMIVKNEEGVLGRALASAAGIGAELIVVDTGSTDRTVEIAQAAGATVHHFEWVNDFSAARNYAFSKASGQWMLVLDADEEITPELRANVARVLSTTTAAALRIPVTGLDDRGELQLTMPSARFVRNGCGYAYEGCVHESMTVSVMRAGGRIDDIDQLPLLHYGYTSAESARKDRHTRNRTLLEAAHKAHPEDPRYWHYLGLELRIGGDLARAAALFDRVLSRAPDHELAAWSASCLASIHNAEQDFGAAWHVVQLGIGKALAGIHCLVGLGGLALREGDADTARWCADEIDRKPGDEYTDRATSLERAAELRASARVEKEGATTKTRDHLLDALKKYPRNTILAEQLVKVCETLVGRGKGAFDAVRRSNNSPLVISAAMTAFYRGGAFEQCVEMGERSGIHNEMWAFALAKLGKVVQARIELMAFGDASSHLAVLFGLIHGDEPAIEHGLAGSSVVHREAFARVRANKKVPPHLAWVVMGWIERAISLREDETAAKLAACLPRTIGERVAFRALATFDDGNPMAALTQALAHPTELGSLEVIGLVAHSCADFSAAATMLSMRAQAGDASVRVYLKAADALARLGRREDAQAIIALGRESRPHSKALVAAMSTFANRGRARRADAGRC